MTEFSGVPAYNPYYKDQGFVERKLEIVNNRPMNVWLYAKCRKYLDLDAPPEEQLADAEVEVSGDYDDNSTGV